MQDHNFYKGNEVRYMIEKGWLVAGTVEGTYKLTAAGQAHSQRVLKSLDFESKIFMYYSINGNTEADPYGLFV